MSTPNEIAPQEIAALDNLVAVARHRIAEARNLLERRTEAKGQLELARRHLAEQPSQSAADEYASAWFNAQTASAVASALEEADAVNDKQVVGAALATPEAYALFCLAWGKRLSALEGLRRTAILKLADARREESAAGQLNPLLIEHAPAVSACRDAVNRIDNLFAEARFGQRYCEAKGLDFERLDLLAMLSSIRTPLPATV